MAKRVKTTCPPTSITPPKALVPLMQAFHVDSDKLAKSLISQAAEAIYGTTDCGTKVPISKDDLNSIASLMKGISPKDTVETLYAAQIVVSHILGLRKLASNFMEDQKLGLNMLRFSSESMQMLGRKRSGGTQNITVNYNYVGQDNAIMQANNPREELIDAN